MLRQVDILVEKAKAAGLSAHGSIITLARSVLADEGGEELEPGLDVVVLEIYADDSIRISAETKNGERVEAQVHEGDWYQRPEERR